MSTRKPVKLLLVGEFMVSGPHPLASAVRQLDAFREAVQPAAEYGLTLYRASTVDRMCNTPEDCLTLHRDSERWQIRGREMTRLLHRLAPIDDGDALTLLWGTVEEGWVTETQVGLAFRERACTARRAPTR